MTSLGIAGAKAKLEPRRLRMHLRLSALTVQAGMKIVKPCWLGRAKANHVCFAAIDLIDEAASKKRIELDSKPEELDELDRKIIQLKIEKQTLQKEGDAQSRNKLKLVEENLNELERGSAYLSNIWRSNKSLIDLQQRKKIELLSSSVPSYSKLLKLL